MASGSDLGIDGVEQVEPVGRGGFAVVYRAWQPTFHRTVAVKVVDVRPDEQAATRFQRECQAMGLLSEHPAIVTILDAGFTTDGRPWLAMPFLSGGSLQDRLDSGETFTWQQMLAIGVRLAGALTAAHDAGVLHRDLKPANVMLSRYGEAMLSDFGIARIAGGPETTSGVVTASVTHAAPEILDGQRPTVASDVYGLASTLYALVSGAPPFTVDTDESVVPLLRRILLEPVPDLRPSGIPDDVCAALERALSKDPADRYATVADFGAALQECQRRHELAVTPMLAAEATAQPHADDAARRDRPTAEQAKPTADPGATTGGVGAPTEELVATPAAAPTDRMPSTAPPSPAAAVGARPGRKPRRPVLLLTAGVVVAVVVVSGLLWLAAGRGPGGDLAFGDRIDGTLGEPGEVDRYTLAAAAGDVFSIHMGSASLDSLLRLRDPDGALVADDDDSGGGVDGVDALLFGTFPAAGLYVIEAASADDQATGPYTLTVSGGRPGSLAEGEPLDDSIDTPGEVDAFTFEGSAGDVVVVRMAAVSTVLDSYLVLFGPDGSPVATDDDSGGGVSGVDALIAVQLPADGTYTVVAMALNAETVGRYQLELRQPEPVEVGSAVEATIDRPGQVDAFALDATAGQAYRIRMSSPRLDSHLAVIGPDGDVLTTDDDSGGGPEGFDALVEGEADSDSDGVYVILARSLNPDARGPYRLEVQGGPQP